jgi:hypothetical protein
VTYVAPASGFVTRAELEARIPSIDLGVVKRLVSTLAVGELGVDGSCEGRYGPGSTENGRLMENGVV